MAAKLEPTSTPGIFRRHSKGCRREGRCECSYVVVWRHRGRQHKATYRTLAEAREAKGERQSGATRPSSKVTLEDYARAWIGSYAGRTGAGIGASSLEAYRRSLERFAIPHFAGRRLADVEPPDVRDFIRSLERRGLAPATIRAVLAPVRAMFATALEDGDLLRNPTAGVRVATRRAVADEEHAKALTREELGGLLAEVPPDWRLFFELLAHTGLRVSEAIGLTWQDVEFGTRSRLRVRRQLQAGGYQPVKSRHGRRDIPLSPRTARALWAAQRGQGADDPVFCTPTGTPLNVSNVRHRVLTPAAKRAGVPWAGFHTLRHTCASLLFEAGKNPKQVQHWLGHHSAAFTLDTYVHLLDEGLGDAAFLDAAVLAREDAEGGAQGNAGATEGPETAANAGASSRVESVA